MSALRHFRQLDISPEKVEREELPSNLLKARGCGIESRVFQPLGLVLWTDSLTI